MVIITEYDQSNNINSSGLRYYIRHLKPDIKVLLFRAA